MKTVRMSEDAYEYMTSVLDTAGDVFDVVEDMYVAAYENGGTDKEKRDIDLLLEAASTMLEFQSEYGKPDRDWCIRRKVLGGYMYWTGVHWSPYLAYAKYYKGKGVAQGVITRRIHSFASWNNRPTADSITINRWAIAHPHREEA